MENTSYHPRGSEKVRAWDYIDNTRELTRELAARAENAYRGGNYEQAQAFYLEAADEIRQTIRKPECKNIVAQVNSFGSEQTPKTPGLFGRGGDGCTHIPGKAIKMSLFTLDCDREKYEKLAQKMEKKSQGNWFQRLFN